jgi:hypothetical protein
VSGYLSRVGTWRQTGRCDRRDICLAAGAAVWVLRSTAITGFRVERRQRIRQLVTAVID